MSLFGGIAKFAKSAIGAITKTPLLGAVVKSIPGLGTAATIASVAGAIGGGVKTASKVIPGRGVLGKAATVGIATTAYQAGKGATPTQPVYDQAGNLVGYQRKRRRMNYANPKAVRRAARRIKGFVKLYHRVEKSLPHKVVHRRS